MRIFADLNNPEIAELLRAGAVGVLPSDTIYGVMASARQASAVERLYELRARDEDKPCILLINDPAHIVDAEALRPIDYRLMERYWPGPVSIIFPVTNKTPVWLHRGQQSLAYRLPDIPELRALLRRSGPLLAPTANVQGQPPATTIDEAMAYFGDRVDFYVDAGELQGQSSTLIKAEGDRVVVLRQGSRAIV